jgi:hypothetical protein
MRLTSCIRGRIGLLFLLVLYSIVLKAQDVGDGSLPMRFSTHTYTVTMGLLGNEVVWNIYDNTATRERIDDGIDKPYSKTTDYIAISEVKNAGIASFTVNFTGNLLVGVTYRIAYREKSKDDCYTYQFFDFVIQQPIDIDVVQVANRCPDTDLQYLEGTGFPVTQSQLEYHVVLRNTDYNPTGGSWYFTYTITVTGQGGSSATIESVTYPGYTFTQPPLQSTNSKNAIISVGSKDIQFLVTINDVLGVRQRIDFKLDNIEGAFSEKDVDVMVPKSGDNEIFHYLDAIPAASYIAALD